MPHLVSLPGHTQKQIAFAAIRTSDSPGMCCPVYLVQATVGFLLISFCWVRHLCATLSALHIFVAWEQMLISLQKVLLWEETLVLEALKVPEAQVLWAMTRMTFLLPTVALQRVQLVRRQLVPPVWNPGALQRAVPNLHPPRRAQNQAAAQLQNPLATQRCASFGHLAVTLKGHTNWKAARFLKETHCLRQWPLRAHVGRRAMLRPSLVDRS